MTFIKACQSIMRYIGPTGTNNLIDEEGFRNSLYMIDIGQNDLLLALYASNLTYEPVVDKIPSFLAEIKLAIQVSLLWHPRNYEHIFSTDRNSYDLSFHKINPLSLNVPHLEYISIWWQKILDTQHRAFRLCAKGACVTSTY